MFVEISPGHIDLQLRPTTPSDEAFVWRVFRDARAEQFEAAGLSGLLLEQVLAQQFRSQAAGYSERFPAARSMIITRCATAIGRLLIHCSDEHWHIVDIALLSKECGSGFGTAVFEGLEASARNRGVAALTLSVLASNTPARRFYLRRGFVEMGEASMSHVAMRKELG
ncbi:GNAT family N-acetyltransferase [Bradyrhizobium betae]|nr:GNAT family N-acetyltransferase [Bradyrhizobium betae]MCS3726139.1 ribosomal protein S18 acetylase RimI-like enzyme [Bradyrhizobium betae]